METAIIETYKLAQHETLANLCALTSDCAVGLIAHLDSSEYFLSKFDKAGITKDPIGDEVSALRTYKAKLQNLSFGIVLFRTFSGVGLLIKNWIYFYDEFLQLTRVTEIVNDFPPDKHHRYFTPKQVVQLTDTLFAVTFNYCSCSPAYYSLLNFEDDTASYLSPATVLPEELYYHSEQHVLPPMVINAVGGVGNDILFHTIGPDRNWYRYGMDFSMMCRLSVTEGRITKMCEVEKGFGRFSSDKTWLMIHQLRTNDTLHVYQTSGEYKAGLSLKPKKNLGHLGKSFLCADIIENSLWLHNATGAVLSEICQL